MQSHGNISIEWKQQLLIINAYGPFNEEGVLEIIDNLKQAILTKNIKSWIRLELWDLNTLGSPVVMNHVKEHFLWCEEQGCRATAVVVNNSLQRNLIEKDFLTNIGIFNSENEANAWLAVN